MTSQDLEHQLDRLLDELQHDFRGKVPADRVDAVARAHFDSLNVGAAINDFIPLLVYRFAREELVRSSRDELYHAA